MTAPPPLHRDSRPATPDAPERLQISVTQVVATALAAISATVVASLFGVAGTVIGAAISSVLSVVGTAVYGHSLRKTRERMRDVVPVAVRRVPRPPNFPPAPNTPARPARPTQHTSAPTFPQPHGSTALGYGPVRYSRPRRRSLGMRIAFGSAALFVAVLAVVTGVEAVAHRPLSDLVRGNGAGSGTTLFGSQHHGSGAGQSTPAQRSGQPTVGRTATVTNTGTPSSRAATHSPTAHPTHTTSPSAPAPSSSASSRTPSASSSAPASPPAANRTGGTAPLG